MTIRQLHEADWDWVLALNTANEIETSPIDRAWLGDAVRNVFCATAASCDAFLIAFDQDAPYTSANFLWFRERYPRFVYVDRVVVELGARGKGSARALYQGLFAAALGAGHQRVVCEVNVDPPNPASDAFHARMAFAEVGRARLANGKTVRYLERTL